MITFLCNTTSAQTRRTSIARCRPCICAKFGMKLQDRVIIPCWLSPRCLCMKVLTSILFAITQIPFPCLQVGEVVIIARVITRKCFDDQGSSWLQSIQMGASGEEGGGAFSLAIGEIVPTGTRVVRRRPKSSTRPLCGDIDLIDQRAPIGCR